MRRRVGHCRWQEIDVFGDVDEEDDDDEYGDEYVDEEDEDEEDQDGQDVEGKFWEPTVQTAFADYWPSDDEEEEG